MAEEQTSRAARPDPLGACDRPGAPDRSKAPARTETPDQPEVPGPPDLTEPASRRLRCALIGCGKVAVKHIKAIRYHKQRLELVALADTRPEAAAAVLKACGLSGKAAAGIAVFADAGEMLRQARPDLVAITTPSGSHYQLAMLALQAGAHVLVEKPLTLSLPEADRLLQEAAERGLKLAVGHIYRFFPLVRELEADLREGRFGRILYGDVKVRWGHDQAYYDQAAWRGTWAQDGGALMNQSIHALDLMTWLLGGKVVAASGWIARQTHLMEAEDLGLAMLRFDHGALCLVEGTTSTDPRRQEASFTIECSEGEIRAGILAGRPSIQVRDRRGRKLTGLYLRRFLRRIWRQGGPAALLQLRNPHSGLYGDLAAAIIADSPPLAGGLSGRTAVAHVLAIYQSAKTGRTVVLPADDFGMADMDQFFTAGQTNSDGQANPVGQPADRSEGSGG